MAGNSTDPGRSVTSKVTAILMAFGDAAALTLTEIAGIAKLPPSTAHRLTSELLAWRLLERTDHGEYQIGLPLRIIGTDAVGFDVRNRAILLMRARPLLAELSRTMRTDAKLGTLENSQVVYLEHSGPSAVGTTPPAPTQPPHETAVGMAMLAFSPASVVDRVLADHPAPAATVLTDEKVRRALSVIRLTQVATTQDDLPSERSAIAVPVFSGGGRVAAAIELAVREPGMDVEAATGALTVACRSLSRQLATEIRDPASDRWRERGNETAV